VSKQSADSKNLQNTVDERGEEVRARFVRWALVFLMSYLILLLGMTRRPGTFDEGIILTAAMRVAAKQIPHRDFYILYGPAQFYILAGLFRLFGQFILIERLYDLFIKALIVTSVYAIASAYCRRLIAASTSIVALLWLFGLNQWAGSASMPVSLLNLISSALVLQVFTGRVSTVRISAAGAAAGMAALFRYDTGVALLLLHVFAIGLATYLRRREVSDVLRAFARTSGPYLCGFSVLTLSPALYYLSVAPLGALLRDMIDYPSKYYYRARNLPFPGVHIHSVENLGLYLPIVIAGIGLYAAVAQYRHTRDDAPGSQDVLEQPGLYGFLITLGLLTLAMYLKGFVRVALIQMHLAIIPSLLLVAVLFEHRSSFPRSARIAIIFLAGLSLLAATSLVFHETKNLYFSHSSVLEYSLSTARRVTPQTEASWCGRMTPLTKGFCFLPAEDRIHTIEFIASHTGRDQRIYVGLVEHEKIFGADNILYFATQRLPATKWSELDPDLESRYDIQAQMIHELETNTPPFVVLDSEFEQMNEPNDSSKSSGVTVLDDYIRNRYEQVETFGILSIWKRRQ
jgi:hypothetical protein